MNIKADNIEVLHHSSIRICGDGKVIYVDPFQVEKDYHDADIIMITHDHYDHFSPDDIKKVLKVGTRIIIPESINKVVSAAGFNDVKIHTIVPGGIKESLGMAIKAIPAYNRLKPFHPKKNGYVGYLFEVNNVWIYVAGDTDLVDENSKVKCNVALVPIGGKYTMDAEKAAELINIVRPEIAIPTHYGSVGDSKKEDEEIFKSLVNKSTKVEIKMQKY